MEVIITDMRLCDDGDLLGSDDGPGGDDLRDLRDGTRDWGKGRVYILYAITDANTIQAVVVHHTIHQSSPRSSEIQPPDASMHVSPSS
jgi:hypothetical protein